MQNRYHIKIYISDSKMINFEILKLYENEDHH